MTDAQEQMTAGPKTVGDNGTCGTAADFDPTRMGGVKPDTNQLRWHPGMPPKQGARKGIRVRARRAMSKGREFNKILAALYEAMFDDALWPKTAGLIDEACRTEGSILGVGNSKRASGVLFTAICLRGRRRPDWEHEYLHKYYETDEHVARFRELPENRISHTRDLFSEEGLKTSFVYNDGMRRCRNQNALKVRLNGPARSQILWTIGDPVDGTDWTSDQIETVTRLLPHIRQFVRVRQALATAEGTRESLEKFLDNIRGGVVQLDRRGRIVGTNDRAQQILKDDEGLTDLDGRLVSRIPEHQERLQELLQAALPGWGEQGRSGSMKFDRQDGETPTVLHAVPVGSGEGRFRSPEIGAVILVLSSGPERHEGTKEIASALGLTAAEAAIATALGKGRRISEIARDTGRAENTIRWHMKHIFTKLGVARQMDVARIVTSIYGAPGTGSRKNRSNENEEGAPEDA